LQALDDGEHGAGGRDDHGDELLDEELDEHHGNGALERLPGHLSDLGPGDAALLEYADDGLANAQDLLDGLVEPGADGGPWVRNRAFQVRGGVKRYLRRD